MRHRSADGTEQPIDPKLVMAIESAFRAISLTEVEFVPTPAAWRQSNPKGSAGGPKALRKAEIKLYLATKHGFQCAYCDREFVDLDEATLDHVIPNSVVGHWQPWNLVLACHPCNNLKDNRVPLVLMPLLCALLHEMTRLAQYQLSLHRRMKPSRKAMKRARRRAQAVRNAIEAMSGMPTRLAIEAPKPRLALLPSEGGQ